MYELMYLVAEEDGTRKTAIYIDELWEKSLSMAKNQFVDDQAFKRGQTQADI